MIIDVAGQVEPKKVTRSPGDGKGLLIQELEFVRPRLGKMLKGRDPLLAESLRFMSSCLPSPKELLWLRGEGQKQTRPKSPSEKEAPSADHSTAKALPSKKAPRGSGRRQPRGYQVSSQR